MSLWKSAAKAYQNHMSRVLRGYGLRLEDIFNESHPEYYKVRSRLCGQNIVVLSIYQNMWTAISLTSQHQTKTALF